MMAEAEKSSGISNLTEAMKQSNREAAAARADANANSNTMDQHFNTFFNESAVAIRNSGFQREYQAQQEGLLQNIARGVQGTKLSLIQRAKDVVKEGAGLLFWRNAERIRAKESAKQEALTKKDILAGVRVALSSEDVLNSIHTTIEKMYDLAQAEASEAARQRGFELERLREAGRGGKGEEKENVLAHREEKSSWWKMLLLAFGVALMAFFKELGNQLKVLTVAAGKALGKLFAPLKALMSFVKESKVFKALGDLGAKIKPVLTSIKNVFEPITKFFSKMFGMAKTFVTGTNTAKGILKFASKFGSILGKIFLPITLLMSAFDFISGFMKGYEEGGILGGLKEGFNKLFKGLIGMPLDLLKDAVGWILGVFGFDNAKKSLESWSFSDLIEDIISGFFDMISGVVDWIGKLFTDPVAAVMSLIGGYLGIIKDFGGWIYRKAIAPIVDWIGTLFGAKEGETSKSIETWVGDKLNKITNFAEEIYNKYIAPIVKWVSDLFGGGDKKGGAGGIKWPDLSAMMPDLPTWDNIKGKIGSLLNRMLQGIAEMIDLPLMGSASRGIASLGASIAAGLGATSVQKYKTSERNWRGSITKEGGMQTIDAKSGRVLTKEELDARTKAAADAKAAAKAAAPVVINQSKVGGDTVVGGSRTQVGITPTAGGPKVPRG
jgi:hypothetical protein